MASYPPFNLRRGEIAARASESPRLIEGNGEKPIKNNFVDAARGNYAIPAVGYYEIVQGYRYSADSVIWVVMARIITKRCAIELPDLGRIVTAAVLARNDKPATAERLIEHFIEANSSVPEFIRRLMGDGLELPQHLRGKGAAAGGF